MRGLLILLCILGMLFSDSVVEIQDDSGAVYETASEDITRIWDILHHAAAETEKRVGFTRSRITVVYPADWPRYKYAVTVWGRAIIREKILLPVGFKRTSLLHEYGHAVFSGLYGYRGDYLPPYGWYSGHCVNSHTDPGFALMEGWAEFYQCWLDDSAYNLRPYADRNVPNIEENGWVCKVSPVDMEGAIATFLWDIADTADSTDHTPGEDDDPWDGRDDAVWEIMTTRPQTIEEFLTEFVHRGYLIVKVKAVILGNIKRIK